MAAFLPLFPLQLVVYPSEKLNLHIFEPRYKQLIAECEVEGSTFGIPAFINNKVMDLGTEIKLLEVERKYPNGEMDIKTQGIGLFNIKKFYRTAPAKLYAGADIERLSFSTTGDYLLSEQIINYVIELFSILNINKNTPGDIHNFNTYQIAHHVGFTLEQEYAFLQRTEEKDRQTYLVDHLQKLIPIAKEMENIRRKVKMNGHFKNITPPNY